MDNIFDAVAISSAFFFVLYKIITSHHNDGRFTRIPDEATRLAELINRAEHLYPGRGTEEQLTALYNSIGDVNDILGNLIPEDMQRNRIRDRIILAREISRLKTEDAEIISDFELVQQPIIYP